MNKVADWINNTETPQANLGTYAEHLRQVEALMVKFPVVVETIEN